MSNPKGSNPIRPKFDPEDPMGKTLIMPMFFLYPEHATSNTAPEFVEDTLFGAHLAVMFPRDSRGTVTRKGSTWTTDRWSYVMTRKRMLLKLGSKMTRGW
jgi:Cns1/TTC4 Wheel domain